MTEGEKARKEKVLFRQHLSDEFILLNPASTTLIKAFIVKCLICCNNSLNDFPWPMYSEFRTTLIFLKLYYIHDFIQLAQELMVLPFCSRHKFYLPSKTSHSSYFHLLEHLVGQFFKSLFIANFSISYMCIHKRTYTHKHNHQDMNRPHRNGLPILHVIHILYLV